jgi:hypothetical protein
MALIHHLLSEFLTYGSQCKPNDSDEWKRLKRVYIQNLPTAAYGQFAKSNAHHLYALKEQGSLFTVYHGVNVLKENRTIELAVYNTKGLLKLMAQHVSDGRFKGKKLKRRIEAETTLS